MKKNLDTNTKMPKYENTDYWLNYIDINLILFFLFFKRWKISVIRFVGTERNNCDEMVKYIDRPYIKPISFSQVKVREMQVKQNKVGRPDVVGPQFVATLIYKHK